MRVNEVLAFLQLLSRETQGHNKEMAFIFKKVLDADDAVVELKYLLNNCSFYGEIGGSIKRQSVDTLEKLYRDPFGAESYLEKLKRECIQIKDAADNSSALLASPLPYSEPLAVINKRDIEGFMTALRTIASVCVYLILSYKGAESIRNLTWNDEVSIQEKAYAVNTKFLPALMNTGRPAEYWAIYKMHSGGPALLDSDCYYIVYPDRARIEAQFDTRGYKNLGELAYVHVDADSIEQDTAPVCWGIGNITSVRPENALTVLQKPIATGLRAPSPEELAMDMPGPGECLDILSGGNIYCITPEKMLTAMNQWKMGHEIESRKSQKLCLICGRRLYGRSYACASHFTRELK